jgi:TDG/mug DNA glycosylase family protein
VLFCGINPGLYSAATGHHFARPGNRFWPTLHAAGFTDRLLHPSEEHELLALGYGITNVVTRASAAADELSEEEVIAGRNHDLVLHARVAGYEPAWCDVLYERREIFEATNKALSFVPAGEFPLVSSCHGPQGTPVPRRGPR